MNREEVRAYVNQYCKLRDIQYAAYELHARKHNLTSKELFVLDIIWFAEDGCLQSEIELVRITTVFSNYMKKHFDEIK